MNDRIHIRTRLENLAMQIPFAVTRRPLASTGWLVSTSSSRKSSTSTSEGGMARGTKKRPGSAGERTLMWPKPSSTVSLTRIR